MSVDPTPGSPSPANNPDTQPAAELSCQSGLDGPLAQAGGLALPEFREIRERPPELVRGSTYNPVTDTVTFMVRAEAGLHEMMLNLYEPGDAVNAPSHCIAMERYAETDRENAEQTGFDIFYLAIEGEGIGPGLHYNFEAVGPPERVCHPQGHITLNDPYAYGVTPVQWLQTKENSPNRAPVMGEDYLAGFSVVAERVTCDVRPELFIEPKDLCIYELHVQSSRQFDLERIPADHREYWAERQGTYSFLACPWYRKWMQEQFGANAIDVMPLYQAVNEWHLTDQGKKNEWRYNMVGHRAFDPVLFHADSVEDIRREIIETNAMITAGDEALDVAPMEVYLDNVTGHTGEGMAPPSNPAKAVPGGYGPTFSQRVLNPSFYRKVDISGCGNSVSPFSSEGWDMVEDSLSDGRDLGFHGARLDQAAYLLMNDQSQIVEGYPMLRRLIEGDYGRLLAEPCTIVDWYEKEFPTLDPMKGPFVLDPTGRNLQNGGLWIGERWFPYRPGVRMYAGLLQVLAGFTQHNPDGVNNSIGYTSCHDADQEGSIARRQVGQDISVKRALRQMPQIIGFNPDDDPLLERVVRAHCLCRLREFGEGHFNYYDWEPGNPGNLNRAIVGFAAREVLADRETFLRNPSVALVYDGVPDPDTPEGSAAIRRLMVAEACATHALNYLAPGPIAAYGHPFAFRGNTNPYCDPRAIDTDMGALLGDDQLVGPDRHSQRAVEEFLAGCARLRESELGSVFRTVRQYTLDRQPQPEAEPLTTAHPNAIEAHWERLGTFQGMVYPNQDNGQEVFVGLTGIDQPDGVDLPLVELAENEGWLVLVDSRYGYVHTGDIASAMVGVRMSEIPPAGVPEGPSRLVFQNYSEGDPIGEYQGPGVVVAVKVKLAEG